MPVTTSATWSTKVLANVFSSEGMLGFAGCAIACASGCFALYMNMNGPIAGAGGSHDFTIFAQMTPRARTERMMHAAPPAPSDVTAVEEIDPIVTGSIAMPQSKSTAAAILTNVVLRQIDGDSALVEMQDNLIVYKIGQVIPGAGRLMAMTRQDGRPALQTSKGLIVER